MSPFVSTFEDESAATRIMRLIERHAPRLMKQGGGALVRDYDNCTRSDGATIVRERSKWRRLTPEQREHILALGRNGAPRVQIVEETGICASTIYRILAEEGIKIVDGRSANNRRRAGR